jgi:murein DD-endopeptidase MepM/ murein hydrolase activator NlpD
VNQEQITPSRDSIHPRSIPPLAFDSDVYLDAAPPIRVSLPPGRKLAKSATYEPMAPVAPGTSPNLGWFESCTLVLVAGKGKFTRSISVPRWLVSCTAAIPMVIFLSSVVVGWYLQAFSISGPMTQDLAGNGNLLAASSSRWASFALVAGTKEAPTMSQMRQKLAQIRANELGLGNRKAAGRLLAGLVDQPWIDAASRYYPAPETLLWPVAEGWFSRGYGSGQNGYHRAFDIMGPMGLDVRAAAPGIVGYVGNTVSGYGNLIIIVHPRGWVTAYGHNQRMYVVPGEYVAQGQVISAMGSTGRSTGPHLHFEFISYGKNCDPAALFRPGIMHPNGKIAEFKQVRWPAGAASRPKEIKCGPRMRHPITVEAEDGIGLVEPAEDLPMAGSDPTGAPITEEAASESSVTNSPAVEATPEPQPTAAVEQTSPASAQ